MNIKSTISFLCLFFLASFSAYGQTHRLSGIIMDKSSKTPVIGAIVILSEKTDSTIQYSALTDNNGRFVIPLLKSKAYKLTIQNLSYQKLNREIEINKKDLNLGIIDLETESKVLNEVVVIGQGPPAIQKGDTTEMSSSAYKTNPDANAEELIVKMPGITIENGTVKAQGEDVKKILVDGKQFFGDDPSVALKNLPADVIDKIQVFNKLSDQSELTGVDDGNSAKTINIVTKQSRRSGQFGKFVGGTDFNNKYLASTTLNVFKGNRRITLIGSLNNINQQNFSSEDLGTSSRGGRGGESGGQSGITNTKSLGMNFTDNWGKKITANGSYFYNSTDNVLIRESLTKDIFSSDSSTTNSNTRTRNYNHRVNMRIEYAIDSMNTLLFMPRFNTSTNESDKFSLYNIFFKEGKDNSSTRNQDNNASFNYNLSNNIIYRHKFSKPRRTLSFNLSTSISDRESENTQIALIDTVSDDQLTENFTNGLSVSANASYTEPITTYGMLMVSLTTSNSKNETDKETYRLGEGSEKLDRLDSLSNVFSNRYNTNRGGLSYIYRKGELNLNFGVEYQQANLSGNQVFPQEGKIKKPFENVLPNFMLMYKMSKKTNLRIFYRTSTDAPSISQLQKVTDNSNRLNLSTGNPDLKQEYSQTLRSQFSFANPDKGINAFLVLSGGYIKDNIGTRTIRARTGSLYLPEYDVMLQKGGKLNIPVNLDYSYNIRTLFNIGKYIKPIRSNISVLGGVSYSQSPGYVDSIFNRSNAYSYTNSLIIASNISEKLDFSVSYTSNYSIAKNTQEMPNLQNTEYWYQSANFKINWIFLNGFVLRTDVAGQFNKGLSSGFNENAAVWNASFGRKFLKNNAGELKISVFDILNQNNNINQNVTPSTIQYSRTNTFPRYFLVIFTYNLRNFSGQNPPSQNRGYERGERYDRGENRGDRGDRMMDGPSGGPSF